MIKTIQDLKRVNNGSINAISSYFSKENKKFFNDIEYKVLQAKKSKIMYLVTLTTKFSGMFGGIKEYTYIIKKITDKGSIQFSTTELYNEFKTLVDVKNYLQGV
jgi:hypothetical protein